METMAFSGMTDFPSLMMGVTSTSSHSMGAYETIGLGVKSDLGESGGRPKAHTLAALKIFLTDSAISGPIPRDGRVQVEG